MRGVFASLVDKPAAIPNNRRTFESLAVESQK